MSKPGSTRVAVGAPEGTRQTKEALSPPATSNTAKRCQVGLTFGMATGFARHRIPQNRMNTGFAGKPLDKMCLRAQKDGLAPHIENRERRVGMEQRCHIPQRRSWTCLCASIRWKPSWDSLTRGLPHTAERICGLARWPNSSEASQRTCQRSGLERSTGSGRNSTTKSNGSRRSRPTAKARLTRSALSVVRP